MYATSKGTQGTEMKEYTLSEIRSACLSDLSRVAGSPVEFSKWQGGASSSSADAEVAVEEPPAKKAKVATLEDHRNPTWALEQDGFHDGVGRRRQSQPSVRRCFHHCQHRR